MVTEWTKAVADSPEKPELVDMAQAVSTFMAVKDEEELVYTQHLHFQTPKLITFPECHKDCGSFDQNPITTPHRAQTGTNFG